jgi:leucine-zipper of insertion element IS481/Integrase core domain
MPHANTRLTVHGRSLLIQRVICDGRPVSHVAKEATEWAYRQIFTTNQARHDTLAPWLEHYNTERIHTGIGATPISRVSPTS